MKTKTKIPDRIASFSIFYPIVFSFLGIIRIRYEIRKIIQKRSGIRNELISTDFYISTFYSKYSVFKIR